MADIPAAVAVALPLVREFEGCRITAYPDPEAGAEPWAISWDSTTYGDGAAVKPGDRISQELANALLAGRLERDHHLLALRIAGWADLSTHQQVALWNASPTRVRSSLSDEREGCSHPNTLLGVPRFYQRD